VYLQTTAAAEAAKIDAFNPDGRMQSTS